MAEISDKIQEIIDRRRGQGSYEGKGRIDDVHERQGKLDKITSLVSEFDRFRTRALRDIENKRGNFYALSIEDPSFTDNLLNADPKNLLTLMKTCNDRLSMLNKRFSRNSINISVIGRHRQGKSKLLQTLSGLTEQSGMSIIIPDADGDDCTGATSEISNIPEDKPFGADIEFYSKTELVEIINNYLKECKSNERISSIEEIKTIDCARIAQSIDHDDSITYSKLTQLKKYIANFDSYKDNIDAKQLHLTDKNEIVKYVAQYNITDQKQKYWNYLAVKKAYIQTHFPFNEAGKIVLVDTIGLGDTAINIEDKMLDTLKNESDAALLVRKPGSDTWEGQDYQITNKIQNALKGRSLEKWLFIVINCYEAAGNLNKAEGFINAINQNENIKKAFVKSLDCADEQKVTEELLKPVLKVLSDNLDDLDKELIESCDAIYTQIFEETESLGERIKNILNFNIQRTCDLAVLEKDWEKLNYEPVMKILVNKYKEKLDKPCKEIEKDFEGIYRELQSHCPTHEQIAELISHGNGQSYYSTALKQFCDQFRVSIIDLFTERISKTSVIQLEKKIKEEIIDVFYNTGLMKEIPLKKSSFSGVELETWLQKFTHENLSEYAIIHKAFSSVCEYHLSINGYLQYLVNDSLLVIDPLEEDTRKHSFKTPEDRDIWVHSHYTFISPELDMAQSDEEAARMIEQFLMAAIPKIIEHFKEKVKEFLLIPYHSFYSLARNVQEKLIVNGDGRSEMRRFYASNPIWDKENYSEVRNKNLAISEIDEISAKFNALSNTK